MLTPADPTLHYHAPLALLVLVLDVAVDGGIRRGLQCRRQRRVRRVLGELARGVVQGSPPFFRCLDRVAGEPATREVAGRRRGLVPCTRTRGRGIRGSGGRLFDVDLRVLIDGCETSEAGPDANMFSVIAEKSIIENLLGRHLLLLVRRREGCKTVAVRGGFSDGLRSGFDSLLAAGSAVGGGFLGSDRRSLFDVILSGIRYRALPRDRVRRSPRTRRRLLNRWSAVILLWRVRINEQIATKMIQNSPRKPAPESRRCGSRVAQREQIRQRRTPEREVAAPPVPEAPCELG